jgi:HAD superfamily hydrolase (TIGR01509 family)
MKETPMPIRGIIFDLDGTLVDTNWHHVEAWRRTFAAAGYEVTKDRIAAEVGKGGDQLVPTLIGEDADKRDGDAIRKRHNQEFRAIAGREKFAVFPGAVELIEELRRRGLKTALATSSPDDLLKETLKNAGVDFTSLVDVDTTADDADASKPAPDIVQAAVDKLGLPPGECVMIGDTPFDVVAAKRAGVACWGVTCGGCHPAAVLTEAGAAEVWTDPAAILANLNRELGK